MPELIARLDLGSNAARFLLARINPGVGYRVLRRERVQTRLGAGSRGQLPPKAIDLTVASASRFLASLGNGNGHPRPRVMAVATAAVRDAANRDRLIEPLRLREGDLGGGSLQLARVRAGAVEAVASLPLGAVRMTRRFLRHDPPTLRELRAVRQEVRKRVLGVLPPSRRGDELIGLGGTSSWSTRAAVNTRTASTSRRSDGLVCASSTCRWSPSGARR